MEPEAPQNISEDASAENETHLLEEAGRSWKKENRRIIGLIIGVAAFMLVAHETPLKAWITNIQAWKQYIREVGLLAHLGFGGACAGAVMLGVPRLPLCAAAGLLFGFAEGLLLSLAGTLTGSYGAFVFARLSGRTAVQRRADTLPWLKPLLARPSLMRVFWVRQLMLPGVLLNVMLGVSDVGHRVFILGTAFGYLPLNAAFSLVGSGLGKGGVAQTLVQMCAAAAVMNIAGWAIWRHMKNK
jgi:uncharacterized membrane protein YdjX (TVP38/TMEM64 family)